MRVKVIVEYDGTNYSGWQRQINAISVQETIEKSLKKLTKRNIVIHGAGRTDAGVHAMGQVFHFDDDSIPAHRYCDALNSKLPYDIRAISSCIVDDEFHSRFDAIGKHYKYRIINQQKPVAIERNYVWRVYNELDIERMQKGANHMLGEHDFASFMAAHSFVANSIRRIDKIDIIENGNYIDIDVYGNGFLRNMVRIIAGTLMEIGMRKRHYDDIKTIISSKNRLSAGITAPANGLYMCEVFYEDTDL